MPTYVLPQVLVFQDFQLSPAANANRLRAHITGPHAQLIRFNEADEQDLGRLGYYDWLAATAYDWPNRPAGGQVDASYVKLFAKNAILRYFQTSVGGGYDLKNLATTETGYHNRIQSAGSLLAFKDNTSTYPRTAAAFFDRDCQVGDVVKADWVVGGTPYTLWTYIAGFAGSQAASDVAAIAGYNNAGTPDVAGYGDRDNQKNDTLAASCVQIAGPVNTVSGTADATAYRGFVNGRTEEVYTLIVTTSSSGGDFDTATVRVISASGRDDVAAASPVGGVLAVGALGATVTFSHNPAADSLSDSAEAEHVSPIDLIAGMRFRVTVSMNYTMTTAASNTGDNYTGTADTTYIVTVSRGGSFAGAVKPQITVTTVNGVDISGPTTVTNEGDAIAVGTKGVTITFTGNGANQGLCYGDRWYITCTAPYTQWLDTLILGNNIPQAVIDNGATECALTLYIRKPELQIPQNRTGFAPLTNWDVSETEITVNDGIIAYDETWTDGGVAMALPLEAYATAEYTELFVEYRAWLQGLCNEVGTIADVANLNDLISGPLTPDNPLKWGVFKALSNSNGTEVKFTSVCSPDAVESWANVLELLLGRDDVYGLVPLTKNPDILDLWAAHVDGQSTPEQGLWRVAWFNLTGIATRPVVSAGSTVPGYTDPTTSDGAVCLCTITEDPDSTDTEYTIVKCPANNGRFITNGVRAGDIVRCLYTGDGFGNYSYSEFVVDAVQSEDQLRLLTGPDAPVNVAAKTEIWRNLTATEESAAIARQAGVWADRRIRAVWPDTIETGGTVQQGYHLCAALAGLASGVLSQQGLTNVAVEGFTDVPRTTQRFNKPQLDAMAVAGTWIVTQDPNTGTIYTRHAVTTASYEDINYREEMITRNVDNISYRFKDTFKPYIGVTNVTPSVLRLIALDIDNLVDSLKVENATKRLGPPLIDANVTDGPRQHLTLKDRVVVTIELTVPYALNNLEIHLVV